MIKTYIIFMNLVLIIIYQYLVSIIGIDNLLEEITKDFDEYVEDINDDILRFSIVGRPNTGKSSY